MPELEGLTFEESLREMQLKERRERVDLITIYKFMNNLEETNRKDLTLRSKGESRNLKEHKKNAETNLLERYRIILFSPKKYRYLEWTEIGGDNGKECTSTEG